MADDVEMTPISPAEGGGVPPKVSPFGAAPAAVPPADPASASAAPAVSPSAGVSTIKLKPVIRKPMIHKPTIGGAKPAALVPPTVPPSAAKKATQNLKSVTGPIPVQATLKKTGIIAEGIITPQQQQAAKSKTSRISLESAIGVAPAKDGPAPLKTIRLRRPTDLKPAGPVPLIQKPADAAAVTPPSAAPAAVPEAAAVVEPEKNASPADDPSVTQKKTLKLHRPSGIGIKPPTIGIQKPAASTSDGVQDIPDLGAGDVPELTPLSPVDFGANSVPVVSSGTPAWLAAISLVASLAALLATGYLVWRLYGHVAGTTANQIF